MKNQPKFQIYQRVEIQNQYAHIHNGIHFIITDFKSRVRQDDGVWEWAYTGPGLDNVYVSEEVLVRTNKREGDPRD